MSQIRVLVVDDSAEWRGAVETVLADSPDLDPIIPNGDPAAGFERLRPDRPDILVLGVDGPGIRAAEYIRTALDRLPNLGILLTAESGTRSADRVIEALEAGAFDFVLKTDGKSRTVAGPAVMARRLLPKIRTFSAAFYSRQARHAFGRSSLSPASSDEARLRARPAIAGGGRRRGVRPPEVVLVGASTGGPEALARVLPAMPRSFPIPIVVVQHMPESFIPSLCSSLDAKSRLSVRESGDGERPLSGHVYFASGGRHVELVRDEKMQLVIRHSNAPPVNGFRPSADVLFRSAARVCKGAALGVILTGMGSDGADGLRELKAAGAHAFAQDEESSVVWGMPGRAVGAGLIDEVLALDLIAGRIVSWVER